MFTRYSNSNLTTSCKLFVRIIPSLEFSALQVHQASFTTSWQANMAIDSAFKNACLMQHSNLMPNKFYSRFVLSPGSRFPLTANIFPVVPATKPSTCLVYCSTCLLFNILSNLDGSVGSFKSFCHSSSGSKGCFDNDRAAFSAFLFVCHCCILACSLASARE